MQKSSFIYRNIFIYRLVLNILYRGGYKQRFNEIIGLIKQYKPTSVTELCFGDTYIAGFCRDNKIEWFGIDVNEYFVKRALRKGFNASVADLVESKLIPSCTICIISGSLYHFHSNIHQFLQTALASSTIMIISEPIKNLADKKGIVGWLAHTLSNAGKGKEIFRYNETSLKRMLDTESKALNFNYEVEGYFKKDIIVILKKNESKF